MIRILTARIFLRLACFALRVPVPVYKGATNSFRIRAMLFRAILHVNHFEFCVLKGGSKGYTRGERGGFNEQRGTFKYAIDRIVADAPEVF